MPRDPIQGRLQLTGGTMPAAPAGGVECELPQRQPVARQPPRMLRYLAVDDAEAFTEPRLMALKQVWQAKRGDRWLPGRRDFDPIELRHFLGDLYLVDALDWPRRLRFRLVGTRICEIAGRDVTGRHFDEVYPGTGLREAMQAHAAAIDGARPVRCTGQMTIAEKVGAPCEALLLPLSSDQVRVDMLLGMMVFGSRRLVPWSRSRSDGII